jgi:LTXXQ motif family protein
MGNRISYFGGWEIGSLTMDPDRSLIVKEGAKTPLYWAGLAIIVLALALWGSTGRQGDTTAPWSMSMSPFPYSRPQPSRATCEEDINRHVAIAKVVESKLELRGAQNEAWQKIKDAADPFRLKTYDVCKLLPDNNSSNAMTLPSTIEFLEKQLSVQIELVHAIAEPLRALYGMLSPDQRVILDHAPPQML